MSAIKTTRVALAVSAMLIAATGAHAEVTAQASTKVKCAGINTCKGMSMCKSAKNACKGQNTCKGQGWMYTSDASHCTEMGGTVVK